MRSRPIVVRLAVLAAGLAMVPALGAQQVNGLRLSAVLSADTVRIGEPFTIGIIAVSADPVEAPPLLPNGDGWEQLQVVRVETSDSEFRFYYRLVAWQVELVALPDLILSAGSGGGRDYTVSLPVPIIRSVLPAGEEAPLLQSPRPPIQQGFPWALLLVALILLGLTIWWLKHRASPAMVVTSVVVEAPGQSGDGCHIRSRRGAERCGPSTRRCSRASVGGRSGVCGRCWILR